MMQPILDYRAEEALKLFNEAMKTAPDTTLLEVAEDIFGIDLLSGEYFTNPPVPFDREDAMTMVEGRLLSAFAALGLAKFSYVDYEWAKREGLVS